MGNMWGFPTVFKSDFSIFDLPPSPPSFYVLFPKHRANAEARCSDTRALNLGWDRSSLTLSVSRAASGRLSLTHISLTPSVPCSALSGLSPLPTGTAHAPHLHLSRRHGATSVSLLARLTYDNYSDLRCPYCMTAALLLFRYYESSTIIV